MEKFTKARFQARLISFCYAILETRQPDFDPEKIKNQAPVQTIMQALEYANNEETNVIRSLPDVAGRKPTQHDQFSHLIGALEGKNVVYQRMPPSLLLTDTDLFEVEQEQKPTQMETPQPHPDPDRGKKAARWLILVGILAVGLVFYNLPFARERRAYRAIEKAEDRYDSIAAAERYVDEFYSGKHLEEVMFLRAQLDPTKSNCDDYVRKFPDSERVATIRQIRELYVFNTIAENGNQMDDIIYYTKAYPTGPHIAVVNQLYDSIWDSEIAKYQAGIKSKKSGQAVKYFESMLEYMKANRISTLYLTTTSSVNLKDYDEYSREVRELVEAYPQEKSLPVRGNVVSIRENFTTQDQNTLNQILSDGLQSSLDSIFTPGFVRVSAEEAPKTGAYPQAQFDYEIKSQEDALMGKRYPHLWTYYTDNIPQSYIIGITISFHVKFTIPDSNVSFEYYGKGHPENEIFGIANIRDGYRRMTSSSFARFSDEMYSKLGLKQVYTQK